MPSIEADSAPGQKNTVFGGRNEGKSGKDSESLPASCDITLLHQTGKVAGFVMGAEKQE
ncbi:MAG: hypothetical protein ACRERU_12255 [Methylococcales bacterium]